MTESEKQTIKTDPEKAQDVLLLKNPVEFEQTLTEPLNNGSIGILLLYYPAKGQLARLMQINKKNYQDFQLANYKINSLRLEQVKSEVITEELEKLVGKYNEAIIMSALVQAIRDNEANVLTYVKYLQLKEKFHEWPKLGIKNEKILLAWKDFSKASNELEDWLAEKKDSYLPHLEKLIALNENEKEINEEEFYQILKNVSEKDAFYTICNVLLTNPILRKEFLSLSMLSGDSLLNFEKTLYRLLDILNKFSSDNTFKGLILLFKMQIADQRKELLN